MTEPPHDIEPPEGAPIFDRADELLDGTRVTHPQPQRTWRDTWQQFRQAGGRLAQFDTLLLALLVWVVRMAGYGAAFVVVAVVLVVAVGVYGKGQPEEAWFAGAGGQRARASRPMQRFWEVVIVIRMILLYWLELTILGTLAYVTVPSFSSASNAVLVGLGALGLWWVAWWLMHRGPRGLGNTMIGRMTGRRHVRKCCAVGFRSPATISQPLRVIKTAVGWDVITRNPNSKSADAFFASSTRHAHSPDLRTGMSMRGRPCRGFTITELGDRATFHYQFRDSLTVPARPAPVFGGG